MNFNLSDKRNPPQDRQACPWDTAVDYVTPYPGS